MDLRNCFAIWPYRIFGNCLHLVVVTVCNIIIEHQLHQPFDLVHVKNLRFCHRSRGRYGFEKNISLANSDFPTNKTFHQFYKLYTELDLHRLWVVSMEHLQRVWHASRERLPFRTPGSVPHCGTCLCYNCWDQIPRTCHVFTRLFTSNTPWYFLDFAFKLYCVPNSSSNEKWLALSTNSLSYKISNRLQFNSSLFPNKLFKMLLHSHIVKWKLFETMLHWHLLWAIFEGTLVIVYQKNAPLRYKTTFSESECRNFDCQWTLVSFVVKRNQFYREARLTCPLYVSTEDICIGICVF